MTTYFVPVIGLDDGGLPPAGLAYSRWPEAHFVPYVIEVSQVMYDLYQQAAERTIHPKRVVVNDSYIVPPDALYETEHAAWKKIFSWPDMVEQSARGAAE